MKINSVKVEMLRASTAVAEFLVHVTTDGPIAENEMSGRVIGPKCPGITTVEIAYPLVLNERTGTTIALKGVIPEPNLWTPNSPFVYEVVVELRTGEKQTDTRTTILALRGG